MGRQSITQGVKKFFGIPVTPKADEVFDSSSALNAKAAYMTTKYGRDKSQLQLLQDFFTEANDLIRAKTMQNSFCCMIEVDEDIKEYVPRIVKRYQDELGYKVLVIDNNTEIIQDNKPVAVQPNSTFVILMWNSVNIVDKELQEIAVEPSLVETDIPDYNFKEKDDDGNLHNE